MKVTIKVAIKCDDKLLENDDNTIRLEGAETWWSQLLLS